MDVLFIKINISFATIQFPFLSLKLVDCVFIGGYFIDTTGMKCIKIVDTSRVYIYQFQKLKRKLYNCNVNIYFNQKCFYNNLVPNFDRSFVLMVCTFIYTYYIVTTGMTHTFKFIMINSKGIQREYFPTDVRVQKLSKNETSSEQSDILQPSQVHKFTFHVQFITFATVELFVEFSFNDYFPTITLSAQYSKGMLRRNENCHFRPTVQHAGFPHKNSILRWTIPATREIDVLCNPAGQSSCHWALFVNIMIIITLCNKWFLFTNILCERGDLKTCPKLSCQIFSYGAAVQRRPRPSHF